jgi:ribokinase
VTAAVVVVGSVNVDLIVRVPRLPVPGETVIGGRFREAPGGKGANAAAAAARLGVATSFVGLVGRDDLGTRARDDLERAGVDVTHLGESEASTGVAAILVDEEGQNMIAVASGANADVAPAQVRAAFESLAAGRPVVLVNLEIPDEAMAEAAARASERRWPVVLNPAPARPLSREVIAACDVIVANEAEAAALDGVDALLANGVGAVVVTRGAQGADLHRLEEPLHHQPAFPVDVVDTTGAGDAFCAALAGALAEGRDLEDAVRRGAAAGALACRDIGARTALPTRAEVERLLGA